MNKPTIILASSSPYRAELLSKLGLNFSTASPNIDETARPQETPQALVKRLSEAKAHAIAHKHTGLIIACDQVGVLAGEALGKSHNHEKAVKQLQKCAGNRVDFMTSLTLLNTQSQQIDTKLAIFSVFFRKLSTAQIDYYLRQEKPYDCAGSFKSEGLGIALIEKMTGDDPNSLVGLPLIKLITMLATQGIDVL